MPCMCVNLRGLPLKKKKKRLNQIALLFHLTLKPAFRVIAHSKRDNYIECLRIDPCISSQFYIIQKGVVLVQHPIIYHIFF